MLLRRAQRPSGAEQSWRRVRSEDLQEHGFAEILGPAAVEEAQQAAQRKREHEALLATATTDEDRARIEGELAAMVSERNRKVVGALTADEDRSRRLLARCEAYLMAAVEGVGLAREDVPHGIQPRGARSADICVDLGGMFVRPGRLVAGPDAGEDEIPLSEIPVTERITLGLLVMAALEVASVVGTFRGGPRDARAR